MLRYNPKNIEVKWQKKWLADKIYQATDFDLKPKYVMLTEFPYPSGTGIHVGHTREYTLGDVIARYKRMKGFNVLFPMGYDAFGLPTENYAIKNKISPIKATDDNIAIFEQQLLSLGLSIDWDRSFRTSDPSYYKWTQWLFLQFFQAGLAYQDETYINWCPFCKTGLANEEVINGRHERCDTLVEKKLLKQWLLKITEYADRLIDGLSNVDYLPKIATQQINWIGRSEGAEIIFLVDQSNLRVKVFSTRIDTIYSAACLILAPEHPLVDQLTAATHKQAVKDYIISSQSKSDIERQDEKRDKTGVFTGSYAINPVNQEKIPIWLADFVLVGYGTGAVFGDIHDERDAIFMEKHQIKATYSVLPKDEKKAKKVISGETVFTGDGILINSEHFNGLTSSVARAKILEFLVNKKLATKKVNFKLRDWIFSRQHYWGEPIPIIHCPEHGPVAVPDDQLPVVLPTVDNYEPTENGQSPLSMIDDWVNTICPTCGKPAKRETDTMPNWAGSSWYYLRYFDSKNDKNFADRKKLDYWQAVDLYLGGMEHTTLHLLYSRFWHQFLFDQGLVPTPEPYLARRGQGIILGPDGTKMSKSKGNVIDPTEVIRSGYGADSLRVAIAFIAPYDLTTAWNPEILGGTYRFLNRIWVLVHDFVEKRQNQSTVESDQLSEKKVLSIINKLILKVTDDIDKMNFNTAIAAQMEALNVLYKLNYSNKKIKNDIWQNCLESFLKLLAPFAPHVVEELWQILTNSDQSIHLTTWPVVDVSYLTEDMMTIVVQINGKWRTNLMMSTNSSEDDIKNLALKQEKIQVLLKNKTIIKTIFVPGKLINIVI